MIDAGVGVTDGAGSDRQFETRARKQQAVALLGLRALGGDDLQTLMAAAVIMVADVLDVELCAVLEVLPGRESLLMRAGAGWREGLVGQATVGAERGSQSGYTLISSEPVVVEDLQVETRFDGSGICLDHGAVSGLSAVIHGTSRPWGVLGAYSASRRAFEDDDVGFIQSVANILAAAIERTMAEDALAESEERFRTLVEMAPDAIFSISVSDGTFTSLSPAFEDLTGWSRSEWLGRSFVGIVYPSDLSIAMDGLRRLLDGQQVPPFELRINGRDGQEIAGEFRLTAKVEDGRVVELFGIARDVRERRRADEELRHSRDELEIILRGVTDGITVQDATGRMIYANAAAARITGCESVDDLLATPANQLLERFEMFDDDGEPFPLERLPGRAALQGRDAPETLIRFRVVATGEDRWSLLAATPVLDQHGQPRYAINIFHDVTERIRAERVQDFLAEATSLLSSTLDFEVTLDRVAHIAVPALADLCVFDIVQPDGSLRRIAAHADPEIERNLHSLITGHPIEPGHPVMRALQKGEVAMYADVSSDSLARAGLTSERLRVMDAIGFRSVIVVPLESRGRRLGALSLMYAESGRHYRETDLSVALELAHRSATAVDNALLYRDAQQAAARLRALANASHAFAEASLDLQAVLDAVARSAGELIGDQCIVRLVSDDGTQLSAVAVFHPDADRHAHLTAILGREKQRSDEGLVGRVFTTGAPVFLPRVDQDELRLMVAAGHGEDIRRTPLHSIIIVPVLVRERAIGTLGLGRERPVDPYSAEDLMLLEELADRAGLAIENARLYREARDAVQLREQFLSIASHELKTPLTSLKGSAQLLQRRLRHDPIDRERVDPLVGQVQSEVARLENLVLDLLDASRIQQGRLSLRRELVDLVDLAKQAIDRFETTALRLPLHNLVLDASDPVVATIDPGRIDQVITNLVSNALKYSPDGGEVRVRVSIDDSVAVIAVRDEGIGISDDEQTNLFQPFARGDVARQSIGGTGLGLFISSEIVERHGGTIDVTSALGKGSTFTVRLPVS